MSTQDTAVEVSGQLKRWLWPDQDLQRSALDEQQSIAGFGGALPPATWQQRMPGKINL
jgi:hypothetical protein